MAQLDWFQLIPLIANQTSSGRPGVWNRSAEEEKQIAFTPAIVDELLF